MVDEFDDIVRKGDVVPDRLGLQEIFDHVPFQDVVRIIHDDVDDPVLSSQRDPQFPAEIVPLQVDQQIARDRQFVRERDELAAEKFFEGAADILPRNLVFPHDEIFNGLLRFA